ncbi:MAG TPA: alpha-glucan family phosphorylase [Candidatus Tectomicrobia bacterium]
MASDRTIAYFSMEIGLEVGMPTYSGGLGVLAGDTIRSAADLKLPLVAVTLLHRKGYFYQRLDASGRQHEEPVSWVVDDFVHEMPVRTSVTIAGRTVHLRAWQYTVRGLSGSTVPVYFLDADVPENTAWDRTLTDRLYGGDAPYRLCQEVLLGIGGVRLLRTLGYTNIARFHMNEGHASLLTLELLDEHAHRAGRATFTHDDVEAVRQQCVFTTHTPVPAGHDQFPLDLVARVLGDRDAFHTMPEVFCCEGVLNMTYLALNLSHYVNGVAKKHGEVSQHMFARYVIDAITNGVHAGTWTAPPFQVLFDRYIPGWREDNFSLRAALSIPPDEVWQAHMAAKRQLIAYVNHDTNAGLDVDTLTLGFARRATAYKRADLLFQDIERLKHIATQAGAFQVLYAGKAHPRDDAGKALIQRIYQARDALKNHVKIAYLANYDLALGSLLTAGVDVWLNTPQPPLEASGTSGMKAALNGVPSFSILDGWWLEGHIEGVTGWAIGANHRGTDVHDERAHDAAALYDKLEQVIVPLFYSNRAGFINVMRHAIAINGHFFNTQRMMHQYVMKAYFL